MTREVDIETMLDRWLLEGPTEIPDRSLSAVADRIERQPQRGRWRRGPGTYPAGMNARIAVALLAVVIVAAVAFALLRRASDADVGVPAQTPSPGATGRPSFACYQGSSTSCLGPLDAGVHESTQAAFAYEIPAGWVNPFDRHDAYLLSKVGAPKDEGIWLFRDAVIANECTGSPEPGLGDSVDDFIAHLTTHPGLVASDPTPTTIGGLSGKTVDLATSPLWAQDCPGVGPGTYLTDPDLTREQVTSGFDFGITGPQLERTTILDAGDRRDIVIMILAQSGKTRFDALVQEATPIVTSFVFEARPPSLSTPPSASP
jgi:hypothetical protein